MIKVTGVEKMLRELDAKLGPDRMDSLAEKTVKDAAPIVEKAIREQLETFQDTGATVEEFTASVPRKDGKGAWRVTLHWEGPHQRGKIAHLNEWGTVKNPRPRGKGKIAVGLKISKDPYRRKVRRELKGGM